MLIGAETEYGLRVEGRGAEDQVDDAAELVRGYPGHCFVGWDYRYESPRADLRGFRLDRLAADPEDAKFDRGRDYGPAAEVRSDRILPNGARFYNDHGHPEYSTPECISIFELARHDSAGEGILLEAARAFAEKSGRSVSIYKNNTDFHGASYGTHESYLAPRELGFNRIYEAVLPMLIARQILTGAGKVGSETGRTATYQISQRADFFAEAANAETLFRRPIFNTRDEPHADPRDWIRLHVISGDANMIAAATARKFGLVKLALELAMAQTAPIWKVADPVKAFQDISRDEKQEFRVELAGRSWTTAGEILESYFAAAEQALELDSESRWLIETSRQLLIDLYCDPARFRRQVDWAAKRFMLEQIQTENGTDWRDPSLRAYDLEYHNPDPDEGLFDALIQMDEVEPRPSQEELESRREGVWEDTRARARSIAVTRFGDSLVSACWRSLVFKTTAGDVEVDLPPDTRYTAQLDECQDVGTFIEAIRGLA
jgi:proteasome accessory factor A